MNDIHFDINYLSIIQRDTASAEGEVSQSIAEFEKIARKVEGELSSFQAEGMKAVREAQASINEVKDLKGEVDKKISDAEKQRQKEAQPPSRPSVPANATPEQRNAIMSAYNDKVSKIESQNAQIRAKNEKIDAFVSRANEYKSKLDGIISKLYAICDSMKSELEQASSRVHEFMGRANEMSGQGSRVNRAMGEFSYAMREACESAQALYMLEPSKIRSMSYMDKSFEIKNTHTHYVATASVFHTASVETQEERIQPKQKNVTEVAGETLIKAKNEDEFFESAEGVKFIKMPSANLHRLGGKKFVAKMNDMGYTLVTQRDGSTIDLNGMLHWEKK